MIDLPDTRYAVTRDGAHIAYQVVGEGARDLIYVPSWTSPVDLIWDHPISARFLGRLASFSRLIIFDKRGSGSSDNVAVEALATLEDWTEDMVAVMDAAGSERAAVVGAMVGAPIAMMFAATHPDRISELVLISASARPLADDDYPGIPPEELPKALAEFMAVWGTERYVDVYAPSMTHDLSFRRWVAGFCRLGNPPAMATAVVRIGGVAVHIGQRISALAAPAEVLVSRTVTDLVAGSGIEFTDRGEHELKGVPGSWRVFAVESSRSAGRV